MRGRGNAPWPMQHDDIRLALRRLEEALVRQRERLQAASVLDPQGQLARILEHDLTLMEQERARLLLLLAKG